MVFCSLSSHEAFLLIKYYSLSVVQPKLLLYKTYVNPFRRWLKDSSHDPPAPGAGITALRCSSFDSGIQLFSSPVLHGTIRLRSLVFLYLLFYLLVDSGPELRPVAKLE